MASQSKKSNTPFCNMDNTPENTQKRPKTNPTALFGQPGDIPSNTPIPGVSRAMSSDFGPGLTAPAAQQAPGGLFGPYSSSVRDSFGDNTASQVSAAQSSMRPTHGGLFGGAQSGSNLFGGGTEPPPLSSTKARPPFGLGSASHFKPAKGSGLFGNVGQTRQLREGGLFGHVAAVGSEPARADHFGCNLLTIHVGKDERARTFSLHTRLLTARSTYFRDSITANPEQKTFDLRGIDPRAFALYFQLIYTGHIPSKPNDVSNTEHDEYALLCKLYIIAHFVEDAKAENYVLDAILAKATESADLPSSDYVWIVYASTGGPCKARKMIVDFYTYKATGEWMRAQGEDAQGRGFPPEFWSELAMSLVDKRSVPDQRMASMDAKEYHGQ
ncbi:hypothetical protein BKA58DRAFT_456703 [Alternaria rosae]|uniref:uncharacterized protein n=1 Tax=Alternaria rosae TaxID=1187941 RepID=UPI001E8D3E23|nr:uncharacterized protein BKA58DRAFT_456703 [Alternaria rosae]KAH6873094.1 hypothetical protein BKA58DRAFT_456703 [Alternaria rosae]